VTFNLVGSSNHGAAIKRLRVSAAGKAERPVSNGLRLNRGRLGVGCELGSAESARREFGVLRKNVPKSAVPEDAHYLFETQPPAEEWR
jgi:hypothetical protein